MADVADPLQKLSSPRIFLVRMLVFVLLCAALSAVLYRQIWAAFLNNPGLNGVIFGVLFIGILFAFRQVSRLIPEVEWVNSVRLADPGIEVARAPVLLAPMAALLRDRIGRMAISQGTMRGIMESIGTRLDEGRELLRYLTGLLVFLGLLGTFWGLLETVSSIGNVISSLDVGPDSGSLVLGFLDLQAGQAQNRFYIDLEDWLSTTVGDLHEARPPQGPVQGPVKPGATIATAAVALPPPGPAGAPVPVPPAGVPAAALPPAPNLAQLTQAVEKLERTMSVTG